jgi:hypothetical protein
MGVVLDSGVLIAAERDARPVSELLASLEREHGETEIVVSSITVLLCFCTPNTLHGGRALWFRY